MSAEDTIREALLDEKKIRQIAQGNRELFRELMKKVDEESRRRFLHYKPYSKQLEFHNSLATERILSGGNQSGKSQPLDENVLTPSGWVKMGDIEVGDYVIGSDGEAKRVIGVYPQGERDIYKIRFHNGAEVRCDKEHLWTFFHKTYKTYTAREALERLKNGERLVTPQVKEVRFNVRNVEVDPYLLGLLIGDGCLKNRAVEITNIDKEIIDYCRDISGRYNCTLKQKNDMTYKFLSNDQKENELMRRLSYYDLMGCYAQNKFIPDDYKYNSREIRIEVLRGLVDTDGCIDRNGGVEFYSVSKQLCDDVYEIAMSLGIKASVRRKNGRYKGNKHLSWRVSIGQTDICLSNLKRKAERQDMHSPLRHGIGIESIEDCGRTECKCIKIDSEDELYVTSGFILTHNTLCGCMETCFHLTGVYPEWWSGHRVESRKNPTNGEMEINAWVIGTDSKTVRDSLQSKIIGTEARGFRDGCIHPDYIDVEGAIKSRGVSGLIDTIYIKHKTGCNVKLQFRSYEQGRENLQSATIDFVYCDEEPPSELIGELRARLGATGGFMYMAFTPLKGMTPLVQEFWGHDNPEKFLVCMNIYEASHYTPEKIKKIESLYSGLSEAERKARMMGVPTMGTGLVYPIEDKDITYEPHGEIPKRWKRMAALDFGRGEHPQAMVWGALDPVTDTLYIYDAVKTVNKTVAENASIIKRHGDWIPCAYPHDLNRDSGVGDEKKTEGYKYKELYIKEGVNLTGEHAKTKDGSTKVEVGIIEVRQRMIEGRFKVARHLSEWFKEKQIYRYGDDNKPIKEKDDLMDATRYLTIMLRYAISEEENMFNKLGTLGGATNRVQDNTPVY